MNNILNINIGNSIISYNYKLSYVSETYSFYLISDEFTTPIIWYKGDKIKCYFNGKLMGKNIKEKNGQYYIGDISFNYDMINHILTPLSVQEIYEKELNCCCNL